MFTRSILLLATLLTSAVQAQTVWQLGPFIRPTAAPVILPDPASLFADPLLPKPVHWEALHTFNPAAILRDGKVFVLYRAEDDSGTMQIGMHTSRLGLASSTDGLHFARLPVPMFFPANDAQNAREWPGGVEDPRLIETPDGTYVLTYTQWNRVTYSIGIATSSDLVHWTKYGPAFFSAHGGKYDHLQYKSGGIVTQLQGDRLIAAKIKGSYWMYWGEGEIHLATSSDLIHWTPVEGLSGQLISVLTKRPGHFDSGFPEVGPPPLLTPAGIIVLYNGKNDPSIGDPALGANAYAAGQALFHADNPAALLSRDEHPTLRPEQPYEKAGQYVAGTTFAEGLVRFRGTWFLYYGCADSAVGVVTATFPLSAVPTLPLPRSPVSSKPR